MWAEPQRENSLDLLQPQMKRMVAVMLLGMKAAGYDPLVFETRRSNLRQTWLYGYGRWHHKGKPVKTKTMDSRHLSGWAVDVISKSRGWNYPDFFKELKRQARKAGLHTLNFEGCHVQYGE